MGSSCVAGVRLEKKALKSGRAEHPTKGKKRTEEVKEKISQSMEKQWAELS